MAKTALENVLITNLQKSLLEMDKGFSFLSRQQKISTEHDDFYADLVYYNYLLKCFAVINLMTTQLTPADVGQMDMYVRILDKLKRGKAANPTFGITFCVNNEETMARYSIQRENRQIFINIYQEILPTEEELAALITHESHQLAADENTRLLHPLNLFQ